MRSGRPRLGRQQRRQLWPVFLAFNRQLDKRNLLTFEGAIHQARLVVEQGRFTRYTLGDHSVFRGPEPFVERCRDETAEAGIIAAWIRHLLDEQQLGSHEICITPYKKPVREALSAAGIKTFELRPRADDPGADEPGIRLGTMKRIKGLEFRAVILACADPADPMNHLQEADLLARCERYVASTRAREYLLVTLAD